MALPQGRLRQRPPAFSAVHVDGERAYRRARRGEQVQMPEREVTVHRFHETWREGERAGFEIACSSGTYVRSLIGDLGDAYCLELRRSAIGPFDVADADPARVIGLEQALEFLPECRLDPASARRAAHGEAIQCDAAGPVRLTDAEGLIAIAEPRAGALRPVVGFRG
jgi:tRNA pseudouridine55 synthase